MNHRVQIMNGSPEYLTLTLGRSTRGPYICLEHWRRAFPECELLRAEWGPLDKVLPSLDRQGINESALRELFAYAPSELVEDLDHALSLAATQ